MGFPGWMKKAYGARCWWKCEACGRAFSEGWMLEFHHRNPQSNGGPDTFDNMELLCLEHHYRRHEELRRMGIDHPSSSGLVFERWQRTGGRTQAWIDANIAVPAPRRV